MGFLVSNAGEKYMNPKTIQQVGQMAGIAPKETDAILQDIRHNRTLLESCSKPHDFSICLDRTSKQPLSCPTPQQQFGAHWKCSKCGGRVDSLARIWYNLGLTHSRTS